MQGCSNLTRSAVLGTQAIKLPQCENIGTWGGFALQRCVGSALAARVFALPIAPTPDFVGSLLCFAYSLVYLHVLDDCHLSAHAVGSALWHHHFTTTARHGSVNVSTTLQTLLPLCPKSCASGCSHALLVEFLDAVLRAPWTDELLRTLVAEAGGAMATTYHFQHGIGHGLGAAVAADLITFREASRLCSVTTSKQTGFENCYGGLVMQVASDRLEAGIRASAHVALGVTAPLTTLFSGIPSSLVIGNTSSCAMPSLESYSFAMALGENAMFANCHNVTSCHDMCSQEPTYSKHCTCACDAEWSYAESLQQGQSHEARTCLSEDRVHRVTSEILLQPCLAAKTPIDPATWLGQWCCGAAFLESPADRAPGWSCADAPHPPAMPPLPPPFSPLQDAAHTSIAAAESVAFVFCCGVVLAVFGQRQQRLRTERLRLTAHEVVFDPDPDI